MVVVFVSVGQNIIISFLLVINFALMAAIVLHWSMKDVDVSKPRRFDVHIQICSP